MFLRFSFECREVDIPSLYKKDVEKEFLSMRKYNHCIEWMISVTLLCQTPFFDLTGSLYVRLLLITDLLKCYKKTSEIERKQHGKMRSGPCLNQIL